MTAIDQLELLHPDPDHIPEPARICFEALGRFQDRHSTLPDLPNVEFAPMVVGLFASRPKFDAVAARVKCGLAGHRVAKVPTPMTRGPYEAPDGARTASHPY